MEPTLSLLATIVGAALAVWLVYRLDPANWMRAVAFDLITKYLVAWLIVLMSIAVFVVAAFWFRENTRLGAVQWAAQEGLRLFADASETIGSLRETLGLVDTSRKSSSWWW